MRKNIFRRSTYVFFGGFVMLLVLLGILLQKNANHNSHPPSGRTEEKLSPPKENTNDGENLRSERIEKKLSQPISCKFEKAEFMDVINCLAEKGEIGIVVSPFGSFLQSKPEKQKKISVEIENLPLRDVLRQILHPLDMGFRREGNVIYIASQSKLTQMEMKFISKMQNEADRSKGLEAGTPK